MRKANAVITARILILFILHGVLGAFQMVGAGGTAHKVLARAAFTLIIIHTLIGVKYTVDSLRAIRKSGVSYPGENKLFWARRISGAGVMVLLGFHFGAFTQRLDGALRLAHFDGSKLAVSLLLVVMIAFHVIINVKPMLISFGIRGLKEKVFDILFVLSILLLFMAVGFVIYYLRWNVW